MQNVQWMDGWLDTPQTVTTKNHRGQQLACNKSRELPAKGRGEGGISLAVNEFMPEKV